MMGLNMCFERVIWKIFPKISLSPLLIWNTVASLNAISVEISLVLYLILYSITVVDESEFQSSWVTDPKNLEKLLERPGYQDLVRLGLGHLTTPGQRTRSEPFRISTVNTNFSVCRR